MWPNPQENFIFCVVYLYGFYQFFIFMDIMIII